MDHIAREVEIEEAEIEVFAKRNEEVPRAKRYIIRVDKEKFTVHATTITGSQILALAGKTSDKYKLYQHKRGHQPVLIASNDVVDLRESGVERFTTMAKDTTEGHGQTCNLRREFNSLGATKNTSMASAFLGKL